MAFFTSMRSKVSDMIGLPAAGQEAEPSLSSDAAGFSTTAKQVFDYKKEALALATQLASERHKAHQEAVAAGVAKGRNQTADDFKPTMTDYFIAAQKIGESRAEEMAAKGIEWTPKVIADLSGQEISGFNINKADLQPRPELRAAAALRAQELAINEGREATLTDSLMALQQIQQSGEKIPPLKAADPAQAGIETLKDMADLDGDHAINDFFAAVDRHADFKGTIFSDVSFHPAGTLMRGDENGVALTEGASFNNVTFDGMQADDHVVLAKGDYSNIHFSNIKGGHIDIADGTQVDGMDIRGAHASITIGVASISNLDATDAHIVTLTAAAGAEINQAKFIGTTIDMASELEGSKWKNITIEDSNLAHVNMSGVELNNVSIKNSELAQWDLRGAKINNLSIDGQPITERAQLAALGIEVDAQTTASASPEFVMKSQLASIRDTMQREVSSVGQPAPSPEIPAMTQQLQELRTAMQAATTMAEPPAQPTRQMPAEPQDMTQQLNSLRAVMQTATNGINAALPTEPPQHSAAAAAEQIAQLQESAPRLEVANASLSEALGGFNQGKDLVARTQPEQVIGRTRES